MDKNNLCIKDGGKTIPNNLQMINGVLPEGMCLSQSESECKRIINFRKSYCQDDRPGVSEFHDDGLDAYAYVMYTQDSDENIMSSARLLCDSGYGFPEEERFPPSVQAMRDAGKTLAELGRLVILENKVTLLRHYYQAVYNIAKLSGIDTVLIVMKQRNYSSHEKMMAVKILSNDMGVSWDEEQAELCLVAWDIEAKQDKFHKWVNRNAGVIKKEDWNKYSTSHLGVLVSVQHEVYTYTSTRVKGHVLDAGCGSARSMGYIQENPQVESYTGVDLSCEMIKQARWLRQNLPYEKAHLMCSDIDEILGEFDSIISIHSIYSWSDITKKLMHLFKLLKPGGLFILVTPNNKFDVDKLSKLVKRETLGNPFFEEFLSMNYAIANEINYVAIDYWIKQVISVGFRVQAAHENFFLGGASYLELLKPL